jgi:hypothetical protein
MNLGNDEILECFIGTDAITEAYLGEDLVFSTGPFQGLKIIPKALSFKDGDTVKTVKVKSSEPWEMTVPSWITADTLSGDTGETIVTLTASTQTAETSGSIVVTSTTYSASATVKYTTVKYVEYIQNGTDTVTQGDRRWGIDLDYIPTNKDELVLKTKINFSSTSPDGVLLVGCSQNSIHGDFFRLFTHQSNTFTFDCPRDSNARVYVNYTRGQDVEFEMSWIASSNTATFKNNTTQQTGTSTTSYQGNFDTSWTVWNKDSNASQATKIYWIEIYENGVKVRDYRPAVDDNNVACLHEEINDTYHYNFNNDYQLIAGPIL